MCRFEDIDGGKTRNSFRGPERRCHHRMGSRCDTCKRSFCSDASKVFPESLSRSFCVSETWFRKGSIMTTRWLRWCLIGMAEKTISEAFGLRTMLAQPLLPSFFKMCQWAVQSFSSCFFSKTDNLLYSEKKSLNAISHESAMGLIRQALDKGVNLIEVCNTASLWLMVLLALTYGVLRINACAEGIPSECSNNFCSSSLLTCLEWTATRM